MNDDNLHGATPPNGQTPGRGGLGLVAALLCAALSGGCQDASSQVDDTCPIPPPGRVLVEQVAVRSLVDILIATEHAFEYERAVAFSILGRNFGRLTFAFLAREGSCLGPEALWFIPTCDSQFEAEGPFPVDPFSMTYDYCWRGGCERARVGLVDAYLTVRPRTAPDDRHALEYETTDPVGRIRYDPNPYVTTRVDLTDPAATTVSAELRHRVTFTRGAGLSTSPSPGPSWR